MPINFSETVALVTGANRGLGQEIARALVARGARKVYAAARDPSGIRTPGVVPVALDVTDAAQVAAAAAHCSDVNLLVNNAGISVGGMLLDAQTLERARQLMEVNYFGPLALATAFAPVLRRNGPGAAVANILSVLSWVALTSLTEYSASKAAAWALTNGLRALLQADGIEVVGLHVGYMDTDMAAGVPGDKASPVEVAAQLLDALAAGRPEVLADGLSHQVRSQLSAPEGIYLYGPRG